jgi:hypothetical protein
MGPSAPRLLQAALQTDLLIAENGPLDEAGLLRPRGGCHRCLLRELLLRELLLRELSKVAPRLHTKPYLKPISTLKTLL